jgi:hypothetical protein
MKETVKNSVHALFSGVKVWLAKLFLCATQLASLKQLGRSPHSFLERNALVHRHRGSSRTPGFRTFGLDPTFCSS